MVICHFGEFYTRSTDIHSMLHYSLTTKVQVDVMKLFPTLSLTEQVKGNNTFWFIILGLISILWNFPYQKTFSLIGHVLILNIIYDTGC